MPETAANIWALGPSVDPYEPDKSQIIAWGSWVEQIITAFTSTGGRLFTSLSSLNASLNYDGTTMAWVVGDPVAANNGVYQKLGASGAGSWVRRADLPYSFITAEDAGAGSPNAIQATSSIPVSSSALILLNVYAENTDSPVTVAFNGGSALTIKTRTGEDPDTGELQSGDIVAGRISGSTFRLISDLNSLRNAQSAKAWANNNEDEPVPADLGGDGATTFSARHWSTKADEARDIAAGYASDAVSQGNVPIYATADGVAALTIPVGINTIRVNGESAVGDGEGGEYIAANNGSNRTIVSGDGRTWYSTNINRGLFVKVSSFCSLNDSLDASGGVLAAFAELANSRGRELVFDHSALSKRVYRMLNRSTSAFVIPVDVDTRTRVVWEARVDFSAIGASGTQKSFFSASGPSLGAAVLLASDAGTGSKQIVLAAGGGAQFARGDHVLISSNDKFIAGSDQPCERGEIVYVTNVVGNTLTIEGKLYDIYLVASSAKVQKFKYAKIRTDNPWITGPGRFATDYGDAGLSFIRCDVESNAGTLEYCDYQAYSYDNCKGLVIGGDIHFDPKGSNGEVQYGHAIKNACQDLTIRDARVKGGKHAICWTENNASPGVSRRCHVARPIIEGTWHAGIAQHDGGERNTIQDADIFACSGGIDIRQPYTKVLNPTIYLSDTDGVEGNGIGIRLRHNPRYSEIRGGKIEGGLNGVRLVNADSMLAVPYGVILDDLSIAGTAGHAVRLEPGTFTGTPHTGWEISRLRTRNIAGASILANGPFRGMSISGNLSGNGAGFACVSLTGTVKAVLSNVTYRGHNAPNVPGDTVQSNVVDVT